MPRYVKGDHVVETSLPSEGVELQSQGYKKEKARTKRVQEADARREKGTADVAPSAGRTGGTAGGTAGGTGGSTS